MTTTNNVRGIRSRPVMWAKPGSIAFRECIEYAKEQPWTSWTCPHCGRDLRTHHPKRCA